MKRNFLFTLFFFAIGMAPLVPIEANTVGRISLESKLKSFFPTEYYVGRDNGQGVRDDLLQQFSSGLICDFNGELSYIKSETSWLMEEAQQQGDVDSYFFWRGSLAGLGNPISNGNRCSGGDTSEF